MVRGGGDTGRRGVALRQGCEEEQRGQRTSSAIEKRLGDNRGEKNFEVIKLN